MSDVGKAFRAYLVTKSAVTDEVSTRIYPGVLPQGSTMPCVVYNVITNTPARHMTAQDTNTDALVQVDCFADTYLASIAAAEGIRDAANGYTGAAGTESFRSCYLQTQRTTTEAPRNKSDTHRYRVTQEWRIHLAETAASL